MATVLGSVKVGDLEPDLRAQLTKNNEPLNLTAADSVAVTVKRDYDQQVIVTDGACIVDDAVQGIVTYQWTAGDTDIAGRMLVEFVVTWTAGGQEQTFPANETLALYITPRL